MLLFHSGANGGTEHFSNMTNVTLLPQVGHKI